MTGIHSQYTYIQAMIKEKRSQQLTYSNVYILKSILYRDTRHLVGLRTMLLSLSFSLTNDGLLCFQSDSFSVCVGGWVSCRSVHAVLGTLTRWSSATASTVFCRAGHLWIVWALVHHWQRWRTRRRGLPLNYSSILHHPGLLCWVLSGSLMLLLLQACWAVWDSSRHWQTRAKSRAARCLATSSTVRGSRSCRAGNFLCSCGHYRSNLLLSQ